MSRYKHNSIVLALVAILAGCNGNDARIKEYPKKVVGRWILQKQTSVVNALEEGAEKDTIVVLEDKQYRELSLKPAEIEYGPEGAYLLVFKDYADQIKLRKPGLWMFNHDTLVYMQMDSTVENKYAAVLTDTTMTLKGFIDYDDDGKTDDAYEGFYRKLIR